MNPCDDSGLCEEIDRLVSRGIRSARSVSVGSGWTTLVDVAPLARGHLLYVTETHVPSLAALPFHERVAQLHCLDAVATWLGEHLQEDVLRVEHGAADVGTRFDCVRHAHVHLIPYGICHGSKAVDVSRFAVFASDVRRFDDVLAAYRECHNMDSYLIVSTGSDTLVGRPREQRQVARGLIADILELESHRIDWALNAHSRLYDETVRELACEVQTVG